MTATQSYPWFNGSQYIAELACEHCRGIVRHEQWCITHNPEVLSAWQAVLDPTKLSLHDELILHALGVSWYTRRKSTWKT
jgi:hypothetical protein